MVKKNATKDPKVKSEAVGSKSNPSDKRKRLSFDMPSHLHMKLKIAAVKRDETMGEILCKMIEEHLK